ncbi:venom metalloproteinase antarease TserMP_A-like isoform X2 [Ornithodoros turicata]|uniref:venom metalloproteinase antarease TserMP_A-like isoform X2 n=1 Tax=Ornithodoros turicata TaxID=34597 RepID=UPI003138B0DC
MSLLRGALAWALIVQGVALHGQERSDSGGRVLKLTDDLTLNLVQKSPYPDRLHLRTPQDDGSVLNAHVSSWPYSRHLLQDEKNFASLVVTEDDGLRLRGMIGDDMRIEPLATAERSSDGRIAHRLYKVEEMYSDTPIYQYVSAPILDRTARTLVKTVEGRLDKTFALAETHIVVDTVFFKQFKQNETALLLYLGAAINSVNLRFQTVEILKIQIVVVGLTFSTKDTEDNEILKFYKVGGARRDEYADLQRTLEAFRDFHKAKHIDIFDKVDLLTFLTGRQMCSVNNGNTLDCQVKGMAYVAGVCGYARVSVVEDNAWSFQGTRTMAHEWAHTLGCVHDGSGPYEHIQNHPGATDCPWRQGYLMSYVTEDNNQFQFSPCCANQMYFVSQLEGKQCLFYNNSRRTDQVHTNVLPGETVSLDKLCQVTYAHIEDYTFTYDHEKGLSGYGCEVPCKSNTVQEGRKSYWRTGQTNGTDGSPCDSVNKKKVCIRGECVENPTCKGCKKRPSQPKAPSTTKTPATVIFRIWGTQPRKSKQRKSKNLG